MRDILAKGIPVVIGVLAACFLLFLIVRLIDDQKKTKRFSKNSLVNRLVDELTASMLVKIQNADAPKCEPQKVSMEFVRVFRDSFVMASDSIYFRHERLMDLTSEHDRYLMASAIARLLKQRLLAQLPKVDPINGKPYRLVIEHKWEEFDHIQGAVVCAYYIVPNEKYVEIKNW